MKGGTRDGAGRPKLPYETTVIRVPKYISDEINQYAKEYKLSNSDALIALWKSQSEEIELAGQIVGQVKEMIFDAKTILASLKEVKGA